MFWLAQWPAGEDRPQKESRKYATDDLKVKK
jgi:hypothetical protein